MGRSTFVRCLSPAPSRAHGASADQPSKVMRVLEACATFRARQGYAASHCRAVCPTKRHARTCRRGEKGHKTRRGERHDSYTRPLVPITSGPPTKRPSSPRAVGTSRGARSCLASPTSVSSTHRTCSQRGAPPSDAGCALGGFQDSARALVLRAWAPYAREGPTAALATHGCVCAAARGEHGAPRALTEMRPAARRFRTRARCARVQRPATTRPARRLNLSAMSAAGAVEQAHLEATGVRPADLAAQLAHLHERASATGARFCMTRPDVRAGQSAWAPPCAAWEIPPRQLTPARARRARAMRPSLPSKVMSTSSQTTPFEPWMSRFIVGSWVYCSWVFFG